MPKFFIGADLVFFHGKQVLGGGGGSFSVVVFMVLS